MTTSYVPLVAVSPPEVVLPVLPGEVTAQSPGIGVQTVSGPLSLSERMILYARAAVPMEYIGILEVIGECESHHNPAAVGDGGASLGWFQIWSGWFRDGEDPFNPIDNLRVAVRIRETRGRWGGGGGWTCADLRGIA